MATLYHDLHDFSLIEDDWEATHEALEPRSPHAQDPVHSRPDAQQARDAHDCGRQAVENNLRQRIVVDRFPLSSAGAPVAGNANPHSYNMYGAAIQDAESNPYAPFASRLDWQIALWVKKRGPGSTAASELLSIPGVSEPPSLTMAPNSPEAADPR